MPVDLSTQTRDLFTRIDERQEPISLTEITALAQTTTDTSPTPLRVDVDEVPGSHLVVKRSWWRNLGVAAAAAAALVLLVVGGVSWLSRSVETEDPVDDPSVATSPVATTPDATSPDGGPSSFENLSWQVIDDPAVFGSGTVIYAVTASDSLFVAVGAASGEDPAPFCARRCGISQDGSAAVWTSQNGEEWERVPHEESIFGGPGGQAMWGVTAWEGGFIAVGVDGTSPDLGGSADWTSQEAAVWTSPDGVSWSRVPHDEAVFAGPGRQEMWDVAASGTGLVAIGFDEEGPMNGSSEDQAIWVSDDGISWSQVFGFGVGEMNDIESAPSGYVGVGELSGSAAWTSDDGLSWSLTPDSPLDRDGRFMASLARQGAKYVAVSGRWDGGDIAAWQSDDGANWAFLSEVYPPAGIERFTPTAIAASNSGFVVAANNEMGISSDSAVDTTAVWTSTDGINWTRAEGDEDLLGALIWSVAASDTTVVAGGHSANGAVIWVGSS